VTVRAYSPVCFSDQWNLAQELFQNNGHYPLHLFWDQHNEHRIPILRLLSLIDLYFFRGRNIFLLVASWVTQLAQFALSVFIVKKFGTLSAVQFRTVVGLLAFCEFNPAQLENFTWAFQSVFFLASLFSNLSLCWLVLYAMRRQTSTRRRSMTFLSCSLIFAFLAECNLASGLIIWIVLPCCAVMLRLSRRVLSIILLAGAISIGIYLIGYQSPPQHTNPLQALSHPLPVFSYIQTYFAVSWDQLGRRFGMFASLLAIPFIVIAWAWVLMKDRRGERLLIISLSISMLCLLTAAMTALGRVNFGLDQATAARYQTPAMLFWVFTAISLICLAGITEREKQMVLALIQVICLGLFVFQADIYTGTLGAYMVRASTMDVSGLALEAGTDSSTGTFLFPFSGFQQWYRYLTQKGILPPPFPEYDYVGRPLKSLFQMSPYACSGFLDKISVSPGGAPNQLRAEGWASTNSFLEGRSTIILTTEDNRIAGIGITGSPRPDVVAAGALPESQVNSGWVGYATVPPGAKILRAYEERSGNEVCLLSGEKPIPH
jgi:hypothetical protein